MTTEINFDGMTIHELQTLKQERFQAAVKDGVFIRVAFIARELGHDPASRDADGLDTGMCSIYGPKYIWRHGGINVYVDDYGRYMTVYVDDKMVLSTHQCDQFIIPGDWLKELDSFVEMAKQRYEERAAQSVVRSELLKRLV